MPASLDAPPSLTLPSDQDATGRTLGEEEIANVTEAIRSGTLTSTKGQFTKNLEKALADLFGAQHAYACASGSAAVHLAIAAVKPEPGEEFITTSITDMGALTPILFQGAIPVFADVDPETYNVTAKTIAAKISDRTKGIIVTHLFGNPCDMDPIMELAQKHNLPVFEDSAQALLATYKNQLIGTIGDVGCFSLQQGKHITTGEGGVVLSHDDELAREMFLFINKAWGYGDAQPDHYFSALNYRLTELQGAVALAQSKKLRAVVEKRQAMADRLTSQIQGMNGVAPPKHTPESTHAYWKYCLHVDTSLHEDGTRRLGSYLRERGITCAPRYIQKPAFRCQIFRDQVTLGKSRFPFTLARPEAVNYDEALYPGTFEALERVLVL
ncbi:MAG: DegT/DnrJ/EryC1/StrS family aminotransferase, partial [Verrucomicrobiota bacterium]